MPKRRSFEAQLTRLSLVASIPLLVLLLWVMVYAQVSIWLILLTALMGSLVIVYSYYSIQQKLVYQFRSISNLLDAMIQGDYTLRARSDQSSGALDELVIAINGLANRLSQQRWESVESQLLVRTIIEHIDVAIIALSERNEIRFINPAANKLLGLDGNETDTQLVHQLAFAQAITSGCNQVVELSLGHQQGRFNVHVEEFRESGLQHKLLFITDVRTLLRSEERKAWQSLVRVISHEINNSLSPIASISQTLKRLVERQAANAGTVSVPAVANNQDLIDGLTIISERASSLSQFVESYKQLAKLPEPQKKLVSIREVIEKTCLLFDARAIVIQTDTDAQLWIDPIQFEQVLINLIKNAFEAMAQIKPLGIVTISWETNTPYFKLEIRDQGSGISNPDNLFVPFYSTKKQGSGIGLVLCRQIVEAHNGHFIITNRADTAGCCARIEIPFN